MPDSVDFKALGGVPVVAAGADPADPDAVHWNFGVLGQPGRPGAVVACGRPSLHAAAPRLAGAWDGKTTICIPDLERKVLGATVPAQYQTIGDCGGRAGSGCLDDLQVILIAAGRRAKFHRASHAWPYYLARREYNMLGTDDGVPDGSVPVVLAKYGALNREECGDTEFAGPASDRLAAAWGAGRISGEDRQKYEQLAADNLIKDYARCASAREVADALASGGAVISSDSSGFTMTRDADGICRRQGTWYHYHDINGVCVVNGRTIYSYKQSWGDTTPGGPRLLDGRFPGHCFGIDEAAMDEMCRRGTVHAVFSFALWDEDQSPPQIDWANVF